jgi:hypothetical protein
MTTNGVIKVQQLADKSLDGIWTDGGAISDNSTVSALAALPKSARTPEQQESYRFLVETRGAAGGPSRIWVHNPNLVKASAPLGAYFHPGGYSLSEREREIAVIIATATRRCWSATGRTCWRSTPLRELRSEGPRNIGGRLYGWSAAWKPRDHDAPSLGGATTWG